MVLLSGGASALMSAPAAGLPLAVKQQTARIMMASGAAITELNAVRKHLSAVKGGRLAAACRGQVVTLAISDVVGDDLSVIGSGPGVPDPSTWRDVRDALACLRRRRATRRGRPGPGRRRLRRGGAGDAEGR